MHAVDTSMVVLKIKGHSTMPQLSVRSRHTNGVMWNACPAPGSPWPYPTSCPPSFLSQLSLMEQLPEEYYALIDGMRLSRGWPALDSLLHPREPMAAHPSITGGSTHRLLELTGCSPLHVAFEVHDLPFVTSSFVQEHLDRRWWVAGVGGCESEKGDCGLCKGAIGLVWGGNGLDMGGYESEIGDCRLVQLDSGPNNGWTCVLLHGMCCCNMLPCTIQCLSHTA